jgi:hypothetical protein
MIRSVVDAWRTYYWRSYYSVPTTHPLVEWDWPPRWSPSVPWNWAARDEWPKGGYYLEVRSL